MQIKAELNFQNYTDKNKMEKEKEFRHATLIVSSTVLSSFASKSKKKLSSSHVSLLMQSFSLILGFH